MDKVITDLTAIDSLASESTRIGMALLEKPTPEHLREAVRHFDRAIELRRALPLKEQKWYLYGYIASWLNRGDALARLGGAANLAEALRSFDVAMDRLRDLPMDGDPQFRRRHAIARLNRGTTLHSIGNEENTSRVTELFREAISILEAPQASIIPDRDQVLAAAWMNLGNALLSREPLDAAALGSIQDAARRALALIASTESTDQVSAEIGLKARHMLCRALARLMDEGNADVLVMASEVVDEGMKLARDWEKRGVTSFRPLVNELFRFGARVYQAHQPHFLVEFLLESLDPEQAPGAMPDNREMHAAAMEALWLALAEIQHGGFKQMNTPQFDKVVECLRELRVTEERLIELRRRFPNT